MSNLDRCPSKDERDADDRQLTARDVSAATGRAYWKSLDDLTQSRGFIDFVQREFPNYASELLDSSRRSFLKVMGASLALAGAATLPACRRPDHKILTYAREPEHIIHSKPLFYATAMPLPGGGCEGLLVETYEGRPTKIEGNPLHPHNRGKSSPHAQASILELYDPDRDPELINARYKATQKGPRVTSTREALAEISGRFAAFDATSGSGLAFLVDKQTSPSRDRLRDQIKRRWPQAMWLPYESADNLHELEGTSLAFGSPHRVHLDLGAAETILSIESDFLNARSDLRTQHSWSQSRVREGTREGHTAEGTTMSRLYCVESGMTITGGQADHRAALKPSDILPFTLALARAVADRLPQDAAGVSSVRAATEDAALPAGVDAAFIGALASDLVEASRRRGAVISVGAAAVPQVHAIAAMLNSALGADAGNRPLVRSIPLEGSDAGASSLANITQLAESISAGSVDTLVIISCNPAFTAPADLNFEEALRAVPNVIHLGQPDETAAVVSDPQAGGMHLSRAHYLEAWGDVTDVLGKASIIQPMIKPLFDSISDIELLAAILGERSPDGYAIVRETTRNRLGGGFDSGWARALHDGVFGAERDRGRAARVNTSDVLAAATAPQVAGSELQVVFRPDQWLLDGRYAANAWMQELPDPVTKVAWDNPVRMSPATAMQLGLPASADDLNQTKARRRSGPQYNYVLSANITIDGRTVTAPVWVQPGLADGVIECFLGNGRRTGGRVAMTEGVDLHPLRTSDAPVVVFGPAIERAKGVAPYLLASTQDHWSMEGRKLLREADLPAWQKFGDVDFQEKPEAKDNYGRLRDLNFAGMFGIESHAPANTDVYVKRQQHYYTQIVHDEDGKPVKDKVTGQALVLRENMVARDGRGRPITDEHGRMQALPREQWPMYHGKEPKTEAQRTEAWGRPLPRTNKYGARIQQWGMTIDLTKCTGCSACITACQAENNIPVVGKSEVAKGREMHWMRIDRYYSGDVDTPDMGMQPVTCLHCENAHCEVVCPVNATVHGPQGTNNMAYNRCIGTRYCSNNCPYKVRRFNYFDYATKQFKGDIKGAGFGDRDNAIEPASDHRTRGPQNPGVPLATDNEHFVPPRFRQKVAEVSVMKNNPKVTVRSRGVMEKCTYCIQRVNQASYETKLEDLEMIPDGWFQTACQQACPTDAIVFGDIYDDLSRDGRGSDVSRTRRSARSYALLAYLNSRPRTSYLMRLRNPNPALVDAERKERWEHPFHHGGGHGDHNGHDDNHDGHDHNHDAHGDDDHALRLPILNNAALQEARA